MFGLLNVDKPAGLTSRDVVNRVQRLVRPHKVGHAGTLDPLATGVLVVAVGPATRLVEYVQQMPKTYQATFLLGRTSDTEDIEGTVVELPAPVVPTSAEVEAVLPRFLGTIKQRPPAYSALKVSGQRAYELARRGGAVELAPRSVEVHSLEIVRHDYPELELLVRCGSGTYIRSLGRDLAVALGTGAVMSALRRLAIGSFTTTDAVACDDLSLIHIQARLLPPLLAVGDMPRIALSEDEIACVTRGQPIADKWAVSGDEIGAVDSHGHLVAILKTDGDGTLRPTKCFVQT
ncbi:MAG TPA: tRNA pseudouridine(55) synthase TruB [Pirellulaceae bacterium]|nr:tRNA pseudouridine(55) synthase TruB [Pirellulaceae bacterium]